MADIRIQGVVQFWLTLCIFLILFLLENCAFNLSCLEVKTAYKERGLNENEVPIQAISGNHLEVCSQVSNCCTREMESKLKDLSTREYSINIEDAFRYHVENTFATGIRKFDEFFTSLIDKSQKKLHRMFRRTYGLLYLRGKHLFTSLFNDLREYCEGKNISLTSTLDIFFKSLFSQVFELLSAPRKFSDLYLKCVTSQIENLKPFGDVPGKLSTQVKKSFVAARTFVKGLAFGRDVSLEVLAIPPTKACNRALMKMMYCPHCRGLTQTKPCNNYCLNTMKGCLAYHSELNEVWNDYIEAMKQLASRLDGPFNMEAVVPRINVYISDAIMTLQENSLTVKEQLPTCTSETKDSQPSTSSAAPADAEHHSVRESAAQTTESVLSPEVGEDKCRICGEKEGENRMWIGCEVKDCNFWRHAWCMGVTAYRDRALKNLKFYCPKHIGKKQ